MRLSKKINTFSSVQCDVEFYSGLKRSTSRSLSSTEICYVEYASPRTA